MYVGNPGPLLGWLEASRLAGQWSFLSPCSSRLVMMLVPWPVHFSQEKADWEVGQTG